MRKVQRSSGDFFPNELDFQEKIIFHKKISMKVSLKTGKKRRENFFAHTKVIIIN